MDATNTTLRTSTVPTMDQMTMFLTHVRSVMEYFVEFDKPGRRYVRVVKCPIGNGGNLVTSQRSVVCFVDLTTGNILKADSWKSPSNRVRGHVSNPVGCFHKLGLV